MKLAVLPYCLQNTFNILHDIVIPETQNLESLVLQPSRSFVVLGFFPDMLTAVNFHNQTPVEAHEVNDLVAYGFLSPELQSFQPFRS